jgi:6-phosphogluconolactonase
MAIRPESSSNSRRRIMLIASLVATAATLFVCVGEVSAGEPPVATSYIVYAGTYTGADSKGIYAYRFDTATGGLRPLGLKAEIEDPSFVVTDPGHRFLYTVSELGNDGKTNGVLSSYAIDAKTGDLKLLNRVSSGGGGSCHLAVDNRGKILFVTNYGSGNVAAFALNGDGSIGRMTGFDQRRGSSINRDRQEGTHTHEAVLSPDNRFLLVPDLGTDQIAIYKVDAAKGTFVPNDPPFVTVKVGAGPRHFVFGPGARFAYVICEMGSSVAVFAFDSSKGSLTPVQAISTLPADFTGENNSAEIQVGRSGRFLYASNRGNDSIAVFAIDAKTGMLTKIQVVSTQGKWPRNFAIDPTGRYLLAANQNSNQVVLFAVDQESGKLAPTGQIVAAPSPVCLLFVPGE